jgi:hypothetical protein
VTQNFRLSAIFGANRSGTTWLGSIFNSHPEVAYRFEPLHRLGDDARFKLAIERLRSADLSDEFLPELYKLLIRAHPATEKPPFFSKREGFNFGKSRSWPLFRGVPRLSPLYAAVYSPAGRPPLVFKEIDMEDVMENLLRRTSMRLIYLIRHPCAVVSSLLEGMERGHMKTNVAFLGSLLEKHDPALAARYVPGLESLSGAAKNALMWRIGAEQGVASCRQHERALLVQYEELCVNTLEATQRCFGHLEIPFDDQTARFVEDSSKDSDGLRKKHGEQFIKDYFSVFRNPVLSMNKWKQELSQDQIDAIFDVVRDSPAFVHCAALGHWDT